MKFTAKFELWSGFMCMSYEKIKMIVINIHSKDYEFHNKLIREGCHAYISDKWLFQISSVIVVFWEFPKGSFIMFSKPKMLVCVFPGKISRL